MRLLFINHSGQLSGAERGLLDLVRFCHAHEHECHLAAPGAGTLQSAATALGCKSHAVNVPRPHKSANPLRLSLLFGKELAAAARIRRLIRDQEFEIVHANSTSAMLCASLAMMGSERPLIWHCRDLVALGRAGSWCARRAKAIVSTSQAVQELLSEIPEAEGKTVLARNGTDPDEFKRADRREAWRRKNGIPLDAPLVSNIGQLVPWKHQIDFIETAAIINQSLPATRYVVVGDDLFGDHPGYDEELRRRAATLGIEEKMLFLGYCNDIPAVLESSDLLLHTAHPEPFGRVITEALSMECPVVAVDCAGPSEIVRNGIDGILVPTNDVRATARAAISILTDKEKARHMGRSGRDRVIDTFSAEQCAQTILNLYHQLHRAMDLCPRERKITP